MSSTSSPRAISSNKRGGGLLSAAWLLLIALLSGGGAWIFAVTRGVEPSSLDRKLISAVLPLPPPSPTEKPVAGESVAGPAPAKTATPSVKPEFTPSLPPPPPPLTPEPPKAAPVETPALIRAQPLASIEPALLRESPYGPVPRLSEDRKRAPWQVYAAPFIAKDTHPRISVVVTGLGLAKDITNRAIANLPSEISLSFSPYAAENSRTVAQARQHGHEVLFDLALEPTNYPIVDPGPATLRAVYSAADNILRMDWVLAQAQGAIGVVAQFGDSFSESSMAMAPVAQALRERGLLYVDNRASDHPAMVRLSRDFAVPWAFADVSIPADAANESKLLMANLQALEMTSVQRRAVLALVSVNPTVIDTLADWARTLEQRGFALAPVSAIANRQDERDAVRR